MVPFQKSKERQTLAYSSGNKIVFNKIPFGGKIVRAWLRVSGTVTISGGTTSGTAVQDLAAEFCQKVRVQRLPAAALGQYRVDCSGGGLVRRAQQLDHKLIIDYKGTGAGTITNGAGGAAAYAVEVWIPIIFGRQTALDVRKPEDGGDCTTFQVEMTCGKITDLFNGNDRTWNADTQLQVQWVDEREDNNAPEVPLYIEDHYAQILAATKQFIDNQMPNTGTFVSMLLLTEGGGALGTLVDTIFNSVTLQGPSIDMLEVDPNILKAAMISRRGLDIGETRTGVHNLDFHGRFGHVGVDAGSLYARFDVNNPSGSGLDFIHVVTARVAATEAYLSQARAGQAQN